MNKLYIIQYVDHSVIRINDFKRAFGPSFCAVTVKSTIKNLRFKRNDVICC